MLARYYGTRVADGFFHSFSGWVLYIVAFLMLFAVGWLLDRFKPSGSGFLRAAAPTRADGKRTSVAPTATTPQIVQAEGTE